MLAADHGYFLGPTTRLENPRKTLEPLIHHADAIMITRGVVRNCIDPGITTPVVLRVSGGTSIIGEDLSGEDIVTSVRDAVRLNASAVAMSIFVGSKGENKTLSNLAKLVDECNEYDIPVLAVTAVGKELGAKDARYLALACRIAAELGASFVKTYYCDDFQKVVDGCPVPVVIAGGKRLETEHDVFHLTYDAVQNGAVGVDMGRNIWQNDHPVAMIKAVRAIVHENAGVEEAAKLFEGAKKA